MQYTPPTLIQGIHTLKLRTQESHNLQPKLDKEKISSTNTTNNKTITIIIQQYQPIEISPFFVQKRDKEKKDINIFKHMKLNSQQVKKQTNKKRAFIQTTYALIYTQQLFYVNIYKKIFKLGLLP